MRGIHLAWILTPLLAAALVLQVGEARRRFKASQTLAVVKTVTIKLNQRGRLTPNLIERNIKLLRDAERLDPAEVALPIARGGQYVSLERPKAALIAFEKALTLEPRGEIYAHIGRAELALGRREAADAAFRQAIVLDHNQRRRLESYLLPDRPPRRPQKKAPGELFSSAFETGDLRRWSKVKNSGEKAGDG